MTNDCDLTPEYLAQQFHECYERLAPKFGYETRKESAVAWEDVPEKNRLLMIAVCGELLGIIARRFGARYTGILDSAERIARAERHLEDLVAGDTFRVSIPVEETDSDIILGAGLAVARELLALLDGQEPEHG